MYLVIVRVIGSEVYILLEVVDTQLAQTYLS